MWMYEKRLQYPVNIKNPDADLAAAIISQYGGPDGEMGASMRYLSQRYTMPNRIAMGTLTDIGTEELGFHFEGNVKEMPCAVCCASVILFLMGSGGKPALPVMISG